MNMTLEVAQQAGITNDYIKRNRYKRLKDNTVFVQGCFLVLAKKHERISLSDEPKYYIGYARSDKITTQVPILCSNSVNPKTQYDGDVVGKFEIPNWGAKTKVMVEFNFYGTMFTICCYDGKGSQKRKQELQINYGK
eukprot:143078_1